MFYIKNQAINLARHTILLLTALFFLSSCTKDVIIDIPSETPKLVVNSIVVVGDTIKVGVERSLNPALFNKDLLFVTDAKVLLYIDGSLAETLSYQADSKKYVSHVVAIPGKTYKIAVSAPTFRNVSSVATAHSKVALTELDVKPDANAVIKSELMNAVTVAFQDPPTPGDIYCVRFMHKKTSASGSTYTSYGELDGRYTVSFDVSAEGLEPSALDDVSTVAQGKTFYFDIILLRDEFFNGTSKTLKLYVPEAFTLTPTTYNDAQNNNLPTTDTVYVELQHISEDYYKFLKSYDNVRDVIEGFTEPQNVYSNIVDGYGIFDVVGSDNRMIK